ncbi:hypothetical protein Tco_0662386 [Tanacetum coccineum]
MPAECGTMTCRMRLIVASINEYLGFNKDVHLGEHRKKQHLLEVHMACNVQCKKCLYRWVPTGIEKLFNFAWARLHSEPTHAFNNALYNASKKDLALVVAENADISETSARMISQKRGYIKRPSDHAPQRQEMSVENVSSWLRSSWDKMAIDYKANVVMEEQNDEDQTVIRTKMTVVKVTASG